MKFFKNTTRLVTALALAAAALPFTIFFVIVEDILDWMIAVAEIFTDYFESF